MTKMMTRISSYNKDNNMDTKYYIQELDSLCHKIMKDNIDTLEAVDLIIELIDKLENELEANN
jgi:hypothetical protein